MKKYTYEQIANNFELWQEYVDPNAEMTEADFDAMTEEEKINIQIESFGEEKIASDGTHHANETELADYEAELGK